MINNEHIQYLQGPLNLFSAHKAYSRLDFTDHIVLLGWTDMTIFVLEELLCMLAGKLRSELSYYPRSDMNRTFFSVRRS